MKKIFFLIAVLAMAISNSALAGGDEPAWVDVLRQCSPITSVNYEYDDWNSITRVNFTYEQLLDHSNLESEKLSLRGVIYVPDNVDPDTCINELYFSGYGLSFNDDGYIFGSSYFDNVTQIQRRYNGSFIELEHRYYSKSIPTEPWTKLEYNNANEAAQDFHAIIQALKKVFKGKWAINGISKGGLTSALQMAYYPEDGDVFLANCSPYFKSMTDKRVYKYISENGLTPELRDLITTDRRAILKDAEAVTEFQKLYKKDHPEATDEYCQRLFYTMIMEQYGYTFRSVSRINVKDVLNNNDSVMAEYMKKYNVSASFMNALRGLTENINVIDTWTDYFRKLYPEENDYWAKTRPAKVESYEVPHYEITETDWNLDDEVPYYYQTCHEFGNYTYDFHYLFTDEADQALADSLQDFFDKDGGSYIYIRYPFFKNVEFDNGKLNNFVLGKVKEAQKPIIYLYGEDDCFTGCAIEDEYINGTTSRKYILPAQYHGVKINRDETQRDEIWAFLDYYLRPVATGIKDITEQKVTVTSSDCYNLMGQKVNANSRGIIISGGKKILKH